MELDAAEPRPRDEVDVARLGVGLDEQVVTRVRRLLRDERVVEADVLLTTEQVDLRLRALEDDVLVRQLQTERATEDLMSETHGQEGLLACEQVVDRSAYGADLRVVDVARVTGPGADDHEVGGVEGARAVVVVPHRLAGHAEHGQHVPQHHHEVVLAVEHDHVAPGER